MGEAAKTDSLAQHQIGGSAMDRHEQQNLAQWQRENLEAEEYQRGLKLYRSQRCVRRIKQNPVENCPRCNQLAYEFDLSTGFTCNECDYYPGFNISH